MSEDRAQPIVCASYTHARRHPMVLGSIGGWSPPFQVTMTQLGVLLASALVINKSWHLWGPLFPPIVSVLLALAVPTGGGLGGPPGEDRGPQPGPGRAGLADADVRPASPAPSGAARPANPGAAQPRCGRHLGRLRARGEGS